MSGGGPASLATKFGGSLPPLRRSSPLPALVGSAQNCCLPAASSAPCPRSCEAADLGGTLTGGSPDPALHLDGRPLSDPSDLPHQQRHLRPEHIALDPRGPGGAPSGKQGRPCDGAPRFTSLKAMRWSSMRIASTARRSGVHRCTGLPGLGACSSLAKIESSITGLPQAAEHGCVVVYDMMGESSQ